MATRESYRFKLVSECHSIETMLSVGPACFIHPYAMEIYVLLLMLAGSAMAELYCRTGGSLG